MDVTHKMHMEMINTRNTLFRKLAGKRQLGCPMCGWEGTVRLEPKEILCEDVK